MFFLLLLCWIIFSEYGLRMLRCKKKKRNTETWANIERKKKEASCKFKWQMLNIDRSNGRGGNTKYLAWDWDCWTIREKKILWYQLLGNRESNSMPSPWLCVLCASCSLVLRVYFVYVCVCVLCLVRVIREVNLSWYGINVISFLLCYLDGCWLPYFFVCLRFI